MKPKLIVAMVFALALGLWAQSGEKIGYVDVQKALRETQEGTKVLADIAAEFKPKQTQLQNEQKQIQSLQQQLQNGGDTLSVDAKNSLARSIQTKEQEFQRDAQDAQSDFQTEESDAANRIFRKLLPVIESYAQAHGFALVLDASPPQAPVIFAAPRIDVTEAVVKLYNQQHPAAAAASPAKAAATPPGQ